MASIRSLLLVGMLAGPGVASAGQTPVAVDRAAFSGLRLVAASQSTEADRVNVIVSRSLLSKVQRPGWLEVIGERPDGSRAVLGSALVGPGLLAPHRARDVSVAIALVGGGVPRQVVWRARRG
ncbi:MAG: hypothetical protein R3E84_14120 [Pseudomonadales bacterium]